MPSNARPRLGPSQTFAALKHPNFRLWFTGQLVSLVGTWMQVTAQGFLIYELTQSPAYLGYVGFAAGSPSILFSLFGGVVADRVPRRNLLIITQTSMMILAFIQAGLTFFNLIQPWQVIILAFLNGVATAFDAPTRQAFVLEMVAREDLTNAIALNSMMFNLATVAGPAAAGVAYALIGAAGCFTLNGLSFIAVIVALLMMKLNLPVLPNRVVTSALSDAKEGLSYVAHHRIILTVIVLLGVTGMFQQSLITLMPDWAVAILGGDATTNGLLQSARGLGALIGALMIASLDRSVFKGKLLTLGSLVFPVVMLLFAAIRWLPLSLVALVGVGWGNMLLINTGNMTVQTNTPDELRGRVMSIYVLIFFGASPLGALLTGALAELLGAPLTVAVCALAALAAAVLVWLRVPQLRRVE
jgi:predicted MFS family arabinose efflux permease